MCECFELDPDWQGWERWYFGADEFCDDEPAEHAPEEAASEHELATVH